MQKHDNVGVNTTSEEHTATNWKYNWSSNATIQTIWEMIGEWASSFYLRRNSEPDIWWDFESCRSAANVFWHVCYYLSVCSVHNMHGNDVTNTTTEFIREAQLPSQYITQIKKHSMILFHSLTRELTRGISIYCWTHWIMDFNAKGCPFGIPNCISIGDTAPNHWINQRECIIN